MSGLVPRDDHSLYVGIDPGASGGLAYILEKEVVAIPMPDTIEGIWQWLAQLDNYGVPIYAAVEQVGGYIGKTVQSKDGTSVNTAPGSMMFSFGMNYGACLMGLTALRVKPINVIPRTWQKHFGVRTRDKKGGEKQHQFKGRLKRLAAELFPEVKVTLKICDALLLSLYCKMTTET